MKKRRGVFCDKCHGSRVFQEVADELERAERAHKPMHSPHEGLAVIREEYQELEREVFRRQEKHDKKAMRAEAVQLAAMAIRFVRDVL